MSEFVVGYCEAALWEADKRARPGEWRQNGIYTITDLSKHTFHTIRLDCEKFQRENRPLLAMAYCKIGYLPGHAGKDFYFARNGAGTGFFDNGDEQVWEALQDAAQAYSPFALEWQGEPFGHWVHHN